MTDDTRHELTLWDRCVAAGGASVAAALIVNPLDVVKTRLQAQATAPPHVSIHPAHPKLQTLRAWQLAGCETACQRLATGAAGAAVATTTLPAACAAHCYVYNSAFDGLVKIARQEGLRVLWTGTGISLLMAVPSVGIYLPLYDWLYARWRTAAPEALSPYTPLAAGTVARTVTVIATTPLELLRTRLQAGGTHSGSMSSNNNNNPSTRAAHPSATLVARNGLSWRSVAGAWRGLTSTLARDVPFSAIYWGTVEPIRSSLLSLCSGRDAWIVDNPIVVGNGYHHAQDSSQSPAAHHHHTTMTAMGPTAAQVVAANVVAGGAAGAIAAAITTPLDVVKTQVQLAGGQRVGMAEALRALAQRGGLFAGVGARAARTAPACAIVLSAYELLKFYAS